MTDHARGCEGREYTCTCGYDDARDALIERLVKALEPFATVEPMHVFSAEDDDDNGDYVLTENQFRFARAALAAAKEQQP